VRGTLRKIEVERWGGEQARRYQAGSLNPSKTSTSARELSEPASAFAFFFSRVLSPKKCGPQRIDVLFLRPICGDSRRDLEETKKRPALVWNHGGRHPAGITFGNPSVASG
jgi:hypothetical protein